jgi:hypothetical protein
MRTRSFATRIVVAIAGAAVVWAEPAFQVARNGKPSAVIVVPQRASEMERGIAVELVAYLQRITGATFEIRTDQGEPPPGLGAIHVGNTATSRKLGISPTTPEREAFRIATRGSHLFLTGDDDDGTQFGVYEFLERYCGVRWFWPGEAGEVVPRRPALAVGPMDIRQKPFFQRRTMSLVARGTATEAKAEWQGFGRKWKLGAGVRTVGVHAWGQIAPPAVLGPAHPEYFAQVKGTRQRDWTKFDGSHEYQLCTTNPAVVRLSIEWAARYFSQHPDVDILSISPNDGLGFCECDRCRALDYGKGKVTGDNLHAVDPNDEDRANLSDRMFTYANAVAAGTAKAHPGKRLLMLAYGVYREPPRNVAIDRRVVVQYADNADFHWDPMRKAERVGGLERWAALTSNLMIYEYYTWGANLPARGLTPLIAESIKRFQRLGIRLFRTQSRAEYGLNGVNSYLAAKLLWNPDLDPQEVLRDYFTNCFGDAAQPMERYFRLLDERWKAAVAGIGAKYTPQNALYHVAAYTPQARAEMRGLLREAGMKASNPGTRARVGFFETAFRYSEMTVEAIEQVLELDRRGIVSGKKTYPSIFSQPTDILDFTAPSRLAPARRKEAAALLAAAITKWEERERFMSAIEGQGVMDVRTARANDRYYRFSPLDRLIEVKAAYDHARD